MFGFGSSRQRGVMALAVVLALISGACTSPGDDTARSTTSTTATVPDGSGSETPTTTEPARTSGDPGEVEAALLAGKEVRPGPYIYAEVVPVCGAACDATPLDVYYKPDPADRTRRRAIEAWREDVSFDPSQEIWTGDPLLIGDELLAAIEAGKDVSWEVDRASGLIVSWTVDGVGVSYNCLSVDTATLENRDRTCGGRIYLR